MFKRKMILVCLAIVGLLLFAGCGSTQNSSEKAAPDKAATEKAPANEAKETKSGTPQNVDLRWGTIAAGGAWQVMGSAMLEDIKKANPNITGSTVPSTPTGNNMGVHEKKFDIAFSIADTTAAAWGGEGYFKPTGKIQDIRNLGALYPHAAHIVVGADSNINSIADLKGKRVTPGPKGTSGDMEFQRLIKLYGLTLDDIKVQYLSFTDAAQQMIDGHIDGMFLFSPPPFAPVINVASQKAIKLLSLPDDKIAEMTKFQGVEAYEFPAGMYKGVDKPVKTISARSHMIVHQDMPDELAYTILKSIDDNWSRYPSVLASMKLTTREHLATDVGIPMHPGAVKYLKEKGLMK